MKQDAPRRRLTVSGVQFYGLFFAATLSKQTVICAPSTSLKSRKQKDVMTRLSCLGLVNHSHAKDRQILYTIDDCSGAVPGPMTGGASRRGHQTRYDHATV